MSYILQKALSSIPRTVIANSFILKSFIYWVVWSHISFLDKISANCMFALPKRGEKHLQNHFHLGIDH